MKNKKFAGDEPLDPMKIAVIEHLTGQKIIVRPGGNNAGRIVSLLASIVLPIFALTLILGSNPSLAGAILKAFAKVL